MTGYWLLVIGYWESNKSIAKQCKPKLLTPKIGDF